MLHTRTTPLVILEAPSEFLLLHTRPNEVDDDNFLRAVSNYISQHKDAVIIVRHSYESSTKKAKRYYWRTDAVTCEVVRVRVEYEPWFTSEDELLKLIDSCSPGNLTAIMIHTRMGSVSTHVYHNRDQAVRDAIRWGEALRCELFKIDKMGVVAYWEDTTKPLGSSKREGFVNIFPTFLPNDLSCKFTDASTELFQRLIDAQLILP